MTEMAHEAKDYEGRSLHTPGCSSAMDLWRRAWNKNPVAHPKLASDWMRQSRKCWCRKDLR